MRSLLYFLSTSPLWMPVVWFLTSQYLPISNPNSWSDLKLVFTFGVLVSIISIILLRMKGSATRESFDGPNTIFSKRILFSTTLLGRVIAWLILLAPIWSTSLTAIIFLRSPCAGHLCGLGIIIGILIVFLLSSAIAITFGLGYFQEMKSRKQK